jgi:diguanylate cyclase (GGDEF)-like protein
MELDTATMVAVAAIVAIMTGLFLAYTGWQYRSTVAAGIWGIGSVLSAGGLGLFAADTSYDLAFLFLTVACSLYWVSLARFHEARLPVPFLALAAIAWAVVSFVPFGLTESAGLGAHQLVLGGLFAGCCFELWRGRREKLPARWPLFALIGLHGTVVIGSGVAELVGFGLNTPDAEGLVVWIAVEALVFIIGTTVFISTMIRERGIADERAAAKLDALSALYNRGAFMEAATAALSLAAPTGRPVTAILFDLDHFKRINDTFGHATGDTVIQTFARTLKRSLRRGDISGRLGGEEFAVMLPGAGPEAGIVIAERVRIAFSEDARWIEGQPLNATVSAGVALASRDEPLDRLLGEADRALYIAKTAGRNRVQFAYGEDVVRDPVVLRIA